MRTRPEDQYVMTNEKQQEEFNTLRLQLKADVEFFNNKFLALKKIFATIAKEKQEETEKEINALQKLMTTFDSYLQTLEASKFLWYFTTKKIDDADYKIFQYQANSLHQLRQMVEASDDKALDLENDARPSAEPEKNEEQLANPVLNAAPSRDQLSKLIDDAKNMHYNVSYKKVWLRRTASILTGLVAFVAATALVCLLMTPGVNVLAALTLIPTVLLAIPAFWYMHSPLSITQSITPDMDGTKLSPVDVNVPAVSSIGTLFAGLMGVSAARKLNIMNLPREVAARNTQAATIHCLTDELQKKIAAIADDRKDVREFLKTIVQKADRMYDEGVSAWFYETRTAKTKKAHLILSETAKIMECDGFASLTVESILSAKLNSNANYTFSDLLNSQRNRSTFWKKTSATMDALKQKTEKKPVYFDNIAQAMSSC